MRYRALTSFVLLLAPSAQGEVRRIVPETYYRTFSRAHPPLARVKPGDTIVTKTLDAGGLDEKGISRHERGNPLTGPFYVEGAEAGDALIVKLQRLTMNRNWGWSGYRLGWWSVLGSYMESAYPNRYKEGLVFPGRATDVPWDIDLETKDWIISVGSQPEFASSLDRALQMATTDMARWLVEDYGLEPWAAHLLIGYQARYDVVTVAGSMALRIPRQHLPAGKGRQ